MSNLLVFVGDSITWGLNQVLTGVNNVPTQLEITPVQAFQNRYGCGNFINGGIPGSHSCDWMQGSTNFNNLLSQINQSCFSNYRKFINIMIGANDAIVGTNQMVYQSNLQNQIQGWLAQGFNVQLNYCTYAYLQNNAQLLQNYNGVINQTVNNQTVRLGDCNAFQYFANHPEKMAVDLIHPNQSGALFLGQLWASAFYKAWFSNGVS